MVIFWASISFSWQKDYDGNVPKSSMGPWQWLSHILSVDVLLGHSLNSCKGPEVWKLLLLKSLKVSTLILSFMPIMFMPQSHWQFPASSFIFPVGKHQSETPKVAPVTQVSGFREWLLESAGVLVLLWYSPAAWQNLSVPLHKGKQWWHHFIDRKAWFWEHVWSTVPSVLQLLMVRIL